MNIGVIGAGWIGQPLANELANEHSVWATKRTSLVSREHWNDAVHHIALPSPSHVDKLPDTILDVLIITLPPSAYIDADGKPFQALANWVNAHARYLIYLSSTSVYPRKAGTYDENMAERIVSPHSGVAILDLERWNAEHINVPAATLRLGGLVGEKRLPWQRNLEGWKDNPESVNYVHRLDVINAISSCVENRVEGQFNVVCPQVITKAKVYQELTQDKAVATVQNARRIISARKFMEFQSFSYRFSSVLDFPELIG